MTKVLQARKAEPVPVPVPHSLLWDGALVLCAMFLFFVCSTVAFPDSNSPKAGEQLKWQVVSGGGTTVGSSTNYRLSTTLGQTAVGLGASTSYKINQGFQQSFGATYLCGDANGDAIVDISDAVSLIAYIFSGGSAPTPLEAGDANCDGMVDISDAVYLISYIFSGGAAPCAACR